MDQLECAAAHNGVLLASPKPPLESKNAVPNMAEEGLMMKRIRGLVAATLLLTGFAAHASVVTHGYLTSNDATNYISNSVSGRQYTRLDAFNLTVAQVQASVGIGGAFEGWSIMTSDEMDDFIAAILGVSSTPCDGAVANATSCGTISGWTDEDFGVSYANTFDFIAYLSTTTPGRFGNLEIFRTGDMRKFENMWNEGQLNLLNGAFPVNLMLFRDNAVPAPATYWLIGLGLAILRLRRGRQV